MKNKIVCIGDSLTEGYGIDKLYRWTNLLEKELNIEIVNSGISGDTTGGMLARFKNMVIDYKPTYVIIMGGTNDLSFNLSDEQIISNILAMTRYARYNNIISIIGIPTMMCLNDVVEKDSIFLKNKIMKKRLEDFRIKLLKFIKEDELLFIDFSINITKTLLLDDCLHPNKLGHIVMVENAKIKLLQILNDI